MKKPLLLAGIIIWAAVLVLVTAALISGVFAGGINMRVEAALLKAGDINLSGVANIIVKTDSLNVELFATDAEQMQARQYKGALYAAPEDLYYVTAEGDSLVISVQRRRRILNFNFNERLELDIPAEWQGNLVIDNSSGSIRVFDSFTWQQANLSCSSGNIIIDQPLAAENITLDVNSGSIRVHSPLTVAGKLSVESNSGDIRIDAPLTAQNIYTQVMSGRISLDQVMVEQFDLRSSSGNITAAGLSGNGSVKVNSGDIHVNLTEPLNNVELQASSGNINVDVSADLAFIFEGRCSYGSIGANFALEKNEKGNRANATIGINPSVYICTQSNSGSIHVNQR